MPDRVKRRVVEAGEFVAKIFWVAAERWGVFGNREWQDEFRGGHALTLAKLTKRTLEVLELPGREQAKVVAARRKSLAAKAKK